MRKIGRLIIILAGLNFSAINGWAQEKIIYSHLTDGYWQLWEMESDGSGQKQLTFSKQDKRDPTWVGFRESVIFRTNNGQLLNFDLKNREEQEILRNYHNINNPYFCPVTGELIFVRFRPEGQDKSGVWKTDLKEKNVTLLTKDERLIYQPAFSPDGQSIVFVKADEKNIYHHLWLMKSDGSNLEQITHGAGFETLPNFSPDGRTIVFSSNESGAYEFYLIDVASRKIHQLTQDGHLNTRPRFSKDGKKILFVSNRSGSQQAWVMDMDGTNPVMLTDGQEESVDAIWADGREDKETE